MALKWQSILKITGGGAVSIFVILLLVLNLAGMKYEIPGDINCGTDCFSEIKVNSTYWEVCVEHSGDKPLIYKKVNRGRRLWLNLDKIDSVVDTNPNVFTEILVPTVKRYSEYDTEFGYLRKLKDGDCIIKRRTKANDRPSRIIVHGVKLTEQTIKWGFNLDSLLMDGIEFDPKWIGEDGKIEVAEGLGVSSVKIETGNFGGKEITQTEIDENYPCYLQSDGSITCPIIKADKFLELSKKEDTSKGIPKTDLRKPVYTFNRTEKYVDESGKEFNIDISDFAGHNTTYLNPYVEEKFNLELINGKVRVGFNSNVWEITDFNFGSCSNCTAKSYGIVLDQEHADSDANMVLWLKMTDDATDSSGNGNDGTVYNAVHNFSWYEFDGSEDYINYGKDSSLDIVNEITINVWVKRLTPIPGDGDLSEYDSIVSKGNAYQYFPRIEGDNDRIMVYLKFNDSTNTGELESDNAKIDDHNWHMITCSFSTNDGYIRIYKDGEEKINWSGYSDKHIFLSGSDVFISSLGNTFNGSIDEVIIYNRSLSSVEITNLYNKGLFKHPNGNYTSGIIDAGLDVNWESISWTFSNDSSSQNVTMTVRTGEIAKPDFADSSLVSMWSLNQSDTNSSFTSAVDSMGLNDGEALGGIEVGQTGGVFQGENATSFDGNDDYITHSYNPDGLGAITISFWIYPVEIGSFNGVIRPTTTEPNNYIRIRPTGKLDMNFEGLSDGYLISTNSLIQDKWTHVAVYYNGSEKGYYIDGVFSNSDSTTGNLNFTGQTWAFGWDSSLNNYLNGSLAYVSIFNKSLTSDEIISWGAYTEELLISDGETLNLTKNRYIQYNALLQTNDTKYTPILTQVTIYKEAFKVRLYDAYKLIFRGDDKLVIKN